METIERALKPETKTFKNVGDKVIAYAKLMKFPREQFSVVKTTLSVSYVYGKLCMQVLYSQLEPRLINIGKKTVNYILALSSNIDPKHMSFDDEIKLDGILALGITDIVLMEFSRFFENDSQKEILKYILSGLILADVTRLGTDENLFAPVAEKKLLELIAAAETKRGGDAPSTGATTIYNMPNYLDIGNSDRIVFNTDAPYLTVNGQEVVMTGQTPATNNALVLPVSEWAITAKDMRDQMALAPLITSANNLNYFFPEGVANINQNIATLNALYTNTTGDTHQLLQPMDESFFNYFVTNAVEPEQTPEQMETVVNQAVETIGFYDLKNIEDFLLVKFKDIYRLGQDVFNTPLPTPEDVAKRFHTETGELMTSRWEYMAKGPFMTGNSYIDNIILTTAELGTLGTAGMAAYEYYQGHPVKGVALTIAAVGCAAGFITKTNSLYNNQFDGSGLNLLDPEVNKYIFGNMTESSMKQFGVSNKLLARGPQYYKQVIDEGNDALEELTEKNMKYLEDVSKKSHLSEYQKAELAIRVLKAQKAHVARVEKTLSQSGLMTYTTLLRQASEQIAKTWGSKIPSFVKVSILKTMSEEAKTKNKEMGKLANLVQQRNKIVADSESLQLTEEEYKKVQDLTNQIIKLAEKQNLSQGQIEALTKYYTNDMNEIKSILNAVNNEDTDFTNTTMKNLQKDMQKQEAQQEKTKIEDTTIKDTWLNWFLNLFGEGENYVRTFCRDMHITNSLSFAYYILLGMLGTLYTWMHWPEMLGIWKSVEKDKSWYRRLFEILIGTTVTVSTKAMWFFMRQGLGLDLFHSTLFTGSALLYFGLGTVGRNVFHYLGETLVAFGVPIAWRWVRSYFGISDETAETVEAVADRLGTAANNVIQSSIREIREQNNILPGLARALLPESIGQPVANAITRFTPQVPTTPFQPQKPVPLPPYILKHIMPLNSEKQQPQQQTQQTAVIQPTIKSTPVQQLDMQKTVTSQNKTKHPLRLKRVPSQPKPKTKQQKHAYKRRAQNTQVEKYVKEPAKKRQRITSAKKHSQQRQRTNRKQPKQRVNL